MSFRRKRNTKKGKTKGMKKRIQRLENQLTPLMKTFEQRFGDYISNAQSVPLSGYVADLGQFCPTLQSGGTAITNANIRLGDKITLKSIAIKGEITVGFGVAGDTDNRMRILLVRMPEYRQGASNTAIIQKVLQMYDGGATGSPIPAYAAQYSPYKNVITTQNAVPMEKYEVLYDKQFNLFNNLQAQAPASTPSGCSGASTKENWRHNFSIRVNFKKGLVCQYSKPLSDIPDLNNLLLLAVSDSAVPNHPVIRYCSRVKYMDA